MLKNHLKWIIKKNHSLLCCFIKNKKYLSSNVQISEKSNLNGRKYFTSTENIQMHSVMENLYSYQQSIIKYPSGCNTSLKNILQSEGCLKMSNHTEESNSFLLNKALQTFFTLSEENLRNPLNLENPSYKDMMNIISNSLCNINDDTLIYILHCLCLWPMTASTETPNFMHLWNALDDECANRITSWSTTKLLLVADYWFHLKLSRITKYNRRMIKFLLKKLDMLNSFQFVQLMFYINLQRWTVEKAIIHLENKIHFAMPEISLNELAIISMGFFKSRSKISNSKIIKRMIQLIIEQIPEIDDYCLVSLLKQIRYSSQSEHAKDIFNLYNKFVPHVDNLNPSTCIHLMMIGTNINVHHAEILNVVSKQLLKDIKKVRLKEITKLLHCLSKYFHKPNIKVDIFDILISELKSPVREEEIYMYPDCLLNCLLSLSFFNIYIDDLLFKVLNPDFINLIKEKSKLSINEEILTLYYGAEIEHTGCSKIKLNVDQFIKDFEKTKNPSFTLQDQFLNSICEELNKFFSNKFFSVQTILPYSRNQVIIMSQDKNGIFLPLSIREETSLRLLKPSLSDNWLCIMPLGRNNFSSNDQKLLGLPIVKRRHLMKLGYKVIEIPWFEFIHLSSTDKEKYIKNKIFKNVNSYVNKSIDLRSIIKKIF